MENQANFHKSFFKNLSSNIYVMCVPMFNYILQRDKFTETLSQLRSKVKGI